MFSRRVRNILECARLQLQAGNETRAHSYYQEAARLIKRERLDAQTAWEQDTMEANRKATLDIEAILAAGYTAATIL